MRYHVLRIVICDIRHLSKILRGARGQGDRGDGVYGGKGLRASGIVGRAQVVGRAFPPFEYPGRESNSRGERVYLSSRVRRRRRDGRGGVSIPLPNRAFEPQTEKRERVDQPST